MPLVILPLRLLVLLVPPMGFEAAPVTAKVKISKRDGEVRKHRRNRQQDCNILLPLNLFCGAVGMLDNPRYSGDAPPLLATADTNDDDDAAAAAAS